MARDGNSASSSALNQHRHVLNTPEAKERENHPDSLAKQLRIKEEEARDSRIIYKKKSFSRYSSELQDYLRRKKVPATILNMFFSPRNSEEIQKLHIEGKSYEDVFVYLDKNSSKYYPMNGQSTNYNKKKPPVTNIVVKHKYDDMNKKTW